MFLPVILQKDFGNGAWLLFVIFNIVGATFFPFFINSPDNSIIFIEKNKTACIVFSIVTIIFQAFFIGWVMIYLSTIDLLFISCFIWLLLANWRRNLSFISVVVWFLSLTVFIVYAVNQPNDAIIDKLINQVFSINIKIFYLVPLLALGFLLCPYLDLTFHQVVQAAKKKSERANKISFLIGFPLLFGILMIFSLIYVDTAEQVLLASRKMLDVTIVKALLFYFVMQSSFTGIAHWHQVQHKITTTQKKWIGACVLLMLVLPWLISATINEMIYRVFMAFYGILAPAYVWIVVVNKRIILSTMTILALGVSLIVASQPLFFHKPEYYYVVAVIIILAMPFLAKK